MINSQSRLWRQNCLAMLCVVMSCATATAETIVTFPDANLEASVRNALEISAPAPITATDMLELKGFTSTFTDLSDLTGLEYAANLKVAAVAYCRVSDLRPLSGLGRMEDIVMYGCLVSDVSLLAGLGTLRNLILGDNLLSDVGPLGQLTALTDLDLSSNQIADASSLATLAKLEFLDLSANQVVDISFLTGLAQMRTLGLKDNKVSDIGPLSGLTHLAVLDLRGNPLDEAAYSTFIPEILANNPGIDLMYDPVPDPGTCSLLCLGAVFVLRQIRKTKTMSCKGGNA